MDFADPAAVMSADPLELHRILSEADWTAFDPERDLEPLRARLVQLESEHGVTEAHLLATTRVLASPSARPIPPIVHRGDIQAGALSPCGRYLAVGSGIEIPEGAWGSQYEHGGVLRVFELAMGRSVRTVNQPEALRGGIGWSDYPGAIQWSADSSRIALAFDTNQVGVWAAASDDLRPLATADVTDGGNRPPSYALAPDGRRVFIDVGGPSDEHAVPGCVVPLDSGDLSWYPSEVRADAPEGGPRSMAAEVGPSFEDSPGELILESERALGWSTDGTRVHCVGFTELYALDIATGRPLWIHEHELNYSWWDGEIPVAFSSDGTRVAWFTADAVHLADAATGKEYATLDRAGGSVLVWSDGGRLAVCAPGEVRVVDGGAVTHHLRVAAVLGTGANPDTDPLAWSPDETRLAVVTEGSLEIWRLEGIAKQIARLDVPPEAFGVYWGTALAVLSDERVRFCTPEGKVVNEIEFREEPLGWALGWRYAWPAHWGGQATTLYDPAVHGGPH